MFESICDAVCFFSDIQTCDPRSGQCMVISLTECFLFFKVPSDSLERDFGLIAADIHNVACLFNRRIPVGQL